MFVQHEFIPENHKSVLSQLIRQKDYITEKLLARLYAACNDVLNTGTTDRPEVFASATTGGDYQVATATDERTGVYLQVARGPKGPLLTVGQRWSMEGFDAVTSTVATKIWD